MRYIFIASFVAFILLAIFSDSCKQKKSHEELKRRFFAIFLTCFVLATSSLFFALSCYIIPLAIDYYKTLPAKLMVDFKVLLFIFFTGFLLTALSAFISFIFIALARFFRKLRNPAHPEAAE
jgi:hypothetical protein